MTRTIKPNRAELARFRRNISIQANGCWIWTGQATHDGYGKWVPSPGQPPILTHLYSYLLHNGPVPEGMDVGHECHDRAVIEGTCDGGPECPHRRCCNPQHLGVQSRSENTLAQNHYYRNRSECPHGHAYDEQNTIIGKDGKRRCRECKRLSRLRQPVPLREGD